MLEPETVISGGLSCIGRCELVSTFYFEAKRDKQNPELWEFSVWPDQATCDAWSQPGATTLPFRLELCPLDEGRLQVKNIGDDARHGLEWAYKKGVGPALLRRARSITEKRILSSLRSFPGSNERRSDDAEEMWRKMACRGHALYSGSPDSIGRFEVLDN